MQGSRVTIGILLALVGVAALWFYLYRTFAGFRQEVSGQAPAAARYAGFSSRRALWVALLVSGGHTQLMGVEALGRYQLLGETLDDAAGEAFDKTAKLLGLPYPGGAALSVLAESGNPQRFALPRPMLQSGDLNFSFSGLKTAVLTIVRGQALDHQGRCDLAAAIQEAIVDVLCAKSLSALRASGHGRLVIAGGVGANRRLRTRLEAGAAAVGCKLHFPAIEFCTDNGAMIALAAAMRLQQLKPNLTGLGFAVRPRWDLVTHAAEVST